MLELLKKLLACCQAQLDGDDLGTAKLCLIDDALTGVCPQPVAETGLTKTETGGTLILAGDVSANYSAGQDIDLQNANGESCGSATVAVGETSVVVNEAGNTVITLAECVLDEGKTAAQITQAKPVAAIVKVAIATVKSIAIKKTAIKKTAVAVK